MEAWLLDHEPAVRLGAFLGVLALVALLEAATPRRRLASPRRRRWARNLALVSSNTALARGVALLVPASAVATALACETNHVGLFHAIAAPRPLSSVVSIVVLDLAIYLQHVLLHAVPALWRLHKVHHTDLDIDVTTGTRFHPLEIALSMAIKAGVVALLGAPVGAVIAFEVLLSATALFSHGNLRLPARVDRALRWIVVTPDMHRVHHSTIRAETDSNYGFNLSWWDRLFRTYKDQPRDGHEGMAIGLAEIRDNLTLPRLLALPFAPALSPRG